VLSVADALGDILGGQYTVIVDKSTVPVGTADQVHARIAAKHPDNFAVVSNPEFLREGVAVRDFLEPDRVVIGTSFDKAEAIMRELYAPLTDEQHPLLIMDEYSAELSKYASNAFLATKISFINEIANMADRLGANAEAVARAMGTDPRIGSRFLQAGIGYGGSCFPKDVQALAKTAEAHDYDFKIINAVLAANSAQRMVFIDRIKAFYDDKLAGKRFAVWGLAFKPDNVKRYFDEKQHMPLFASDPLAAATDADALIIATEWKVFRNVALDELKQQLAQPVVFDGRNLFTTQEMREKGFTYRSVGRPEK
jgi:UDPglucose 6-dehydrogenase